MTIDPRILTMPGRSTPGFYRPGRGGVYLSGSRSYSDEGCARVLDHLTHVCEVHVDQARSNDNLRRPNDLPKHRTGGARDQ